MGNFQTKFASRPSEVEPNEVVEHSGSAVLDSSDLNKSHVLTAAGTLTLPETTAADVGKRFCIFKHTASTVAFTRAGADVIGGAGYTTVTNSVAGDVEASFELEITATGFYMPVGSPLGTWIGS